MEGGGSRVFRREKNGYEQEKDKVGAGYGEKRGQNPTIVNMRNVELISEVVEVKYVKEERVEGGGRP